MILNFNKFIDEVKIIKKISLNEVFRVYNSFLIFKKKLLLHFENASPNYEFCGAFFLNEILRQLKKQDSFIFATSIVGFMVFIVYL